MDKLEAYLDKVCRGIAGPRAMRQHIRQELREHVKDAAAEHIAAGMSENDALDKALEEFGGPEEVKAELEATHGHRWVAVAIDKAMQWKENTMKARWIWTTWAHATLLVVLTLELLFVAAIMVFIIPKFREMVQIDMISIGPQGNPVTLWAVHYLAGVVAVVRNWIWIALALIAAWVIFERRVKAENKTFMRLAALGTAAVGLLVVNILMTAALILPLMIELPAFGQRLPEPAVNAQMATLDRLASVIDQALQKKDWPMLDDAAHEASGTARQLADSGAAAPVVITLANAEQVRELRQNFRAARQSLLQLREAARKEDAPAIESAARDFRDAFEKIQKVSAARGATTAPAGNQE